MKLRYVGLVPVTFITGSVGEVEPGMEFTVPDELAPAFLARADVEEVEEVEVAEVEETKPARKRHHDEEPGQSVATDGGDPEKMSEENSGVPNDH
jgi:hypothetical protein